MEEEQAKVSFNIYNELPNKHIGEYNNDMPGVNGNEVQGESGLSPLTENNAYELDSEFYTGYPHDLPSIQELSRTTQHSGQHEVHRPIVLEAGRVDWDYATLTMARHPVVNYPILSHAVMEHTSNSSAFIPQTSKSFNYLGNNRPQLDTGLPHCAFVMGKARLAPIREISIPRLELAAAVISVKLSKISLD